MKHKTVCRYICQHEQHLLSKPHSSSALKSWMVRGASSLTSAVPRSWAPPPIKKRAQSKVLRWGIRWPWRGVKSSAWWRHRYWPIPISMFANLQRNYRNWMTSQLLIIICIHLWGFGLDSVKTISQKKQKCWSKSQNVGVKSINRCWSHGASPFWRSSHVFYFDG